MLHKQDLPPALVVLNKIDLADGKSLPMKKKFYSISLIQNEHRPFEEINL
jgi:hypothetical protein